MTRIASLCLLYDSTKSAFFIRSRLKQIVHTLIHIVFFPVIKSDSPEPAFITCATAINCNVIMFAINISRSIILRNMKSWSMTGHYIAIRKILPVIRSSGPEQFFQRIIVNFLLRTEIPQSCMNKEKFCSINRQFFKISPS